MWRLCIATASEHIRTACVLQHMMEPLGDTLLFGCEEECWQSGSQLSEAAGARALPVITSPQRMRAGLTGTASTSTDRSQIGRPASRNGKQRNDRWCAQVPVIIKVPMARFQGVAYAWIKATGTLRLDPDSALSANTFRTIAPLNNKVMELRKVSAPAHALPGSPERQHLCT